jgi:ABC-2 type transport system ATP-binding protein
MEDFEARYCEVLVGPDRIEAGRALKPIQERQIFGRHILLFDGADRAALAALGEVRSPSLADLFVAMMGDAPPSRDNTGAAA